MHEASARCAKLDRVVRRSWYVACGRDDRSRGDHRGCVDSN